MLLKFIYLCSVFVLSASTLCEDDNCGRNARIAGGQITEPNSRPYQLALYSRVGTTGELGFCGASLINQEWVLTAAHCCFHNGEEVNHVQAILGAHSLYDRYENGRRVVNVAELIIHPAWDPETFANDIALLRLANVIQITDTISPVLLPYRSISAFNFAGFGTVVSGWGIAAEGVTFVAPTLREKLMTVVTDQLCNGSYFFQLPQTTVCAFHGSAGTCKGDNGGPMTILYGPEDEKEEILIGVASFVSSGGCNDNVPSVFTRVQLYLDWISEVTGMQLP
ncbi:brachyurin-like [Anticarsia gemmatalis]|uniref:brachyurin-like n=1 Tax=Anticarsia gemmatalis TaxID=129554 RepID=UPI003F76FB28